MMVRTLGEFSKLSACPTLCARNVRYLLQNIDIVEVACKKHIIFSPRESPELNFTSLLDPFGTYIKSLPPEEINDEMEDGEILD